MNSNIVHGPVCDMKIRLKLLRVMLGLNQFEAAKKSGIGRTRLSLFENGHVMLNERELASIRAALKQAAAERVRAINLLVGCEH
jgi:transcriptional regulator with XRE-family HTH domain